MEKKHSFKGTLIAVLVIIILALLSKFVHKEDFKQEIKYYDPTEPTYNFFENTQLSSAPTEIATK